MAQRIVLFAALLFVALQSGAGLVVWFDLNPAGMSPAFYVEEMQHAIGVYGVPLFTLGILGLFFTIVSTYLARRDRPEFYLLIAASICLMAGTLITAFVHIPINLQIMTWSINSPPSNWTELSEKWMQFHTVRMILGIAGASFLILLALVRRDISK